MKPTILINPSHFSIVPVFEKLKESNKYNLLTFDDFFNRYDSIVCYKKAGYVSKQIIESATDVINRLDLQKYLGDRRLDKSIRDLTLRNVWKHIPSSIHLIEAFKELVSQEDLRLVVLWEDVTAFSKTIALFAKKMGIQTLHITHGHITRRPEDADVHDRNYTNKVAVFGDKAKEYFISHGNSPENMVITGNPAWDIYYHLKNHFDKEDFLNSLGLDSQKPTIVYASTDTGSPFDGSMVEDRYDLVLQAVKKIQKDKDIQLIVKPHMSEHDKAEMYQVRAEAKGVSSVRTIVSHKEEAIVACDLLICNQSNIGIEALLLDKPVISIAFEYKPDENKFFFDSKDAVISIFKPQDLLENMRKLLFDKKFIEKLGRKRPYSISRYNYKNDGRAIERVLSLIRDMLAAYDKGYSSSSVRFISPAKASKAHSNNELLFGEAISLAKANSCILEFVSGSGSAGSYVKKHYRNSHLVSVHNSRKEEKTLLGEWDESLQYDFVSQDFNSLSFSKPQFDLIILNDDSLANLLDPWSTLSRLRQILREKGHIIFSISNVRNIEAITLLAQGYWDYDNVILDSGCIRFFCLEELVNLLSQCQFTIKKVLNTVVTGDTYVFNEKQPNIFDISTPKIELLNLPRNYFEQIVSSKFIIIGEKKRSHNIDNILKTLSIGDDFSKRITANNVLKLTHKADKKKKVLYIGSNSEMTNSLPEYWKFTSLSLKKFGNNILENLKLVKEINKLSENLSDISKNRFDIIIFDNILEHHFDPWTLLHQTQPLLKDGGILIANFTNSRHVDSLASLIAGEWNYRRDTLNVNRLRMFTLKEVKKLLKRTGFSSEKTIYVPKSDAGMHGNYVNLNFGNLLIKNVHSEEIPEFECTQFIISAQKGKQL